MRQRVMNWLKLLNPIRQVVCPYFIVCNRNLVDTFLRPMYLSTYFVFLAHYLRVILWAPGQCGLSLIGGKIPRSIMYLSRNSIMYGNWKEENRGLSLVSMCTNNSCVIWMKKLEYKNVFWTRYIYIFCSRECSENYLHGRSILVISSFVIHFLL